MTPEELEAATSSPLAPPPATPTPYPRSTPIGAPMDMRDFFATLREYESMRKSILDTELGKMESIERIIKARVETALSSSADSSEVIDPVMQEAGKALVGFLKDGIGKERNRSTISPVVHPPVQNTEEVALTPTAPSNEAENMKNYTQEEIDKIADKIEDFFPTECKDCRNGTLTREKAVVMIVSKDPNKSTDEALANRIYESIMAVQDEGAK